MKRRITALFLALLTMACALNLTSCGGREGQVENSLIIWGKESTIETSYIQKIIQLYEEKTENHVQTVSFEDADFEEEAAALYQKGEMPDILLHFNDSDLVHYNVNENFYYLNEENWVDELTSGALAYSLDSNGNLLGLPFWESSLSGCYYNKTVLDGLGLRPAATQTEFDALCAALKAAGYTPLHWSAADCHWMFQFALDPIFADDPELLEKLNRNEITYADIPAVTDMVTWLDKAYRQGWFNSDYATATWEDIPPAVENGEAVCFFIWDTWFSTMMTNEGKYTIDDFALMPVFMGTTENGVYEGGNMHMMMVNKNSERLNMARDFLSFCATAENYNIAFDGVITTSNFKNQTTNIQEDIVTDAMVSIEANQRPSTAWPKVVGYVQSDVGAAVLKLFRGEVDIEGCVALMDESRIATAHELGAEGF